jgi:hypothetical protein
VPTVGLDEFVDGLRNSMAKAQADLTRSNQGRLERLIQLARDGRTEALTWSFVIDQPSAGGSPAAHTMRLPLLTMFPPMAVQVIEAKIDLNVTVERAPARRKSNRRGRLRLRLCRPGESLRHRLHQLSVRLTGTHDVTAELSLDGIHFKTVSSQPKNEPVNTSVTIETKDG